MNILFLTGNAAAPAQDGDTISVYRDTWEVPSGAVSLPALMAAHLLEIRSEHAAWAYDMAQVRTQSGPASLVLGGGSKLSMWWCSPLYERHPKVTPELYDVYLLRTLELFMLEKGATSLVTSGCTRPVNAALSAMCRSRGWAFTPKSEARHAAAGKSRLRRVYDKTPAPLRSLARFGHWLLKIRRRLKGPGVMPALSPEAGTIVTYFPNIDMKRAEQGHFRSRYWESLHDTLLMAAGEKTAKVNWLFVHFPSPQGSLEQCCAMRDRFRTKGMDGLSFNYLEEFLDKRSIAKSLLRYLRIAIASAAAEDTLKRHFRFKNSALDLWPLLHSVYEESFRGWRCLERCLQQAGIEAYVARAGRQAWYTFPLENCPWERMLTHAVHAAGQSCVLGAQHSTIRPTDFRYFDDPRTWEDPETLRFQPDIVAGNGESACRQWHEAGVPESRLHRIEALRYLYLADSKKGQADVRAKKLLVVTSFFRDETDAHLELLSRSIKNGLLDGYEITVKPHPYLPVEERLRSLLGDKADGLRFSTAPIADELASSPIVWASNSTTVALEAAIKGLPVLVMQPAGDFDLCPLQDVKELPRTCDETSVARALADAKPLNLDPGYLCLDRPLPRWRAELGLSGN